MSRAHPNAAHGRSPASCGLAVAVAVDVGRGGAVHPGAVAAPDAAIRRHLDRAASQDADAPLTAVVVADLKRLAAHVLGVEQARDAWPFYVGTVPRVENLCAMLTYLDTRAQPTAASGGSVASLATSAPPSAPSPQIPTTEDGRSPGAAPTRRTPMGGA